MEDLKAIALQDATYTLNRLCQGVVNPTTTCELLSRLDSDVRHYARVAGKALPAAWCDIKLCHGRSTGCNHHTDDFK